MTIVITDEERKLLTRKGFVELYYQNCKICASYREAYEMCETAYVRIVGERRYADWSAFRVVLNRQNRKKVRNRGAKC